MASNKILNLTLFLFLIMSLLLSLSSPLIEDGEDVLDTPMLLHSRSGSMASVERIKKGAHCNPVNCNICPGVLTNNGTRLLYCCKKRCREVLGDRNNCGSCGNRCKLGERCCHGSCTDVFHSVTHCGKCNNKCLPGDRCEYGYCGYA